jgi:thioredoxin-like negative regulator of GroEL
MIPSPAEEQKKEAFRLFEEGQYQESLRVCNGLLETGKDPAIEVLAATDLYYTGRYEDAEVFFRDLATRMPDSSYVHSYLAKVLEARGDDRAIAEYAAAVHLDPTNQDAVRSYAEYLLSRKDYRGALPVLRRLAGTAKKPGDVRNLMRALNAIGRADDALAAHAMNGAEMALSEEYVDALLQTKNFRAAAESAFRIWRETKDPGILRKYLDAFSRYDTPGSLDAYATHLREQPDSAILFDYILLLQSSGDIPRAREIAGTLLATSPDDPACRLAMCDLQAAAGDETGALAGYERLIRDELAARNDGETLHRVIWKYREYLCSRLPEAGAEQRFLDHVSRDMNVVSLLETARFYEAAGNPAEARNWYYRAYRADFLAGGPDYATFLAEHNEERECEKVMLYILANVRKASDLSKVASVIVWEQGKMRSMKRLMGHLIKKLEEQKAALSSDGLELLAIAFFIAASNALEETDFTGCKYYCLCGMDVMPAHTRTIRLEDFLELVRHCKEWCVADRPAMHMLPAKERPAAPVPAPEIDTLPGLSEQEQKIVAFLRSHRTASEMDLRKLLGTRRVAGIVNGLVRKAALQGQSLIGKKGMGKDGEIYEYTGS